MLMNSFMHIALYIAKRVLISVVVVLFAYTITFVLLWQLPSDPVEIMLSGSDGNRIVEVEAVKNNLRERYGLDKPVPEQYATMLWKALNGDLGVSIATDRPVVKLLAENIMPTIQLGITALAFGIVVGLAIAIYANYAGAGWLRHAIASAPPIIAALPAFWVGLLLIQFFSFNLRLFPAVGGSGFNGLVLPSITLGLGLTATIAQVTLRSLEDNLRSPYADFLRAKGLSKQRILLVHALRNAVIPAATLISISIGGIFAGAVVTETIFSRPGLGRLLATSVVVQDIPVVQGVVVLCAISFAIANLIVDLLYPIIDPRISRESGK